MTDFTVVQNDTLERAVKALIDKCHGQAVECGWWHDVETGERINRNKGELLMLIVSEIAEGMEAMRKGKQDDHLPHRPGLEVELADALIRIFDMAGALELDLPGAVTEKLAYNRARADHKPENRAKEGGKKF